MNSLSNSLRTTWNTYFITAFRIFCLVSRTCITRSSARYRASQRSRLQLSALILSGSKKDLTVLTSHLDIKLSFLFYYTCINDAHFSKWTSAVNLEKEGWVLLKSALREPPLMPSDNTQDQTNAVGLLKTRTMMQKTSIDFCHRRRCVVDNTLE